MKVLCPGCSAEFAVDDGRVPPAGTSVRCPRCFRSIDVKREETESADVDPFCDTVLGAGIDALQAPPQAPSKPAVGTYGRVSSGEAGPVDNVWAGARPRTGTPPSSPPGAPSSPRHDLAEPGAPQPQTVPRIETESFSDADLSFLTDPPEVQKTTSTDTGSPPLEMDPMESSDFNFDMSDNLTLSPEEKKTARTSAPVASPLSPEPLTMDEGGLFSVEELAKAQEGPEKLDFPSDLEDLLPSLESNSDDGLFERETIRSDAGPGKTKSVRGGETQSLFDLEELDGAPLTPADSASKPLTQPVEGPSIDDIDFASLLDDIPMDGGNAEQEEVFLVDSPSLDGGEFDKSKSSVEAFTMEELNLDELEDTNAAFKGQEDEIFDLDMEEQAEKSRIPELDRERAAMPRSQPVLQNQEPTSTQRKRSARKKGGLSKVALFLLVLGGMGAAFYFVDPLGMFGAPEKDRDKSQAGIRVPQGGATIKAETIPPEHFLNSPAEYINAIKIAMDQRVRFPERKSDWDQELLWRLAWFQFYFPLQFAHTDLAADQNCQSVYKELAQKESRGNFAQRLTSMELAAGAFSKEAEEGFEAALPEWKKALQSFDAYWETRDNNIAPDGTLKFSLPWPYERIRGEDNVLRARFYVKTGLLDKAAPLVEKASSELQNLPFALVDAEFLAARAREVEGPEGDIALDKAIERFHALVERFPAAFGATNELVRLLTLKGATVKATEQAELYLKQAREALSLPHQLYAYRLLEGLYRGEGQEKERLGLLEAMISFYKENKTQVPLPEKEVLELAGSYVAQSSGEGAAKHELLAKAAGVTMLCDGSCTSPEYFVTSARIFQLQGVPSKAQARISEGLAVEQVAKDATVRIFLAELYVADGKNKKAIAELETALLADPNHLDGLLLLARLYRQEGEALSALETMRKGTRHFPKSLELFQQYVEVASELGQRTETLDGLRRILELSPDDNTARQRIARHLVEDGDYQGALVHFTVLSKKDLINRELRPFYGRTLKETGQVEESVGVFKRLLEEDPADYESARFLADIYLQKEDCTNALVYLEKARRAREKNAEVHYLIGNCYERLANLERAGEAYEKAVTLLPTDLDYMTRYANVLFTLSREGTGKDTEKKLRMALTMYDHIIREREKKPGEGDRKALGEVYYNRGVVRFEAGRYEEAREDFSKAGFLEQYRYDILLKYADTLFKTGKFKEAETYYKDLVRSGFEEAHASFYLGRIELRWKNPHKAKEYFLECIRMDSSRYPDAYRYLGDIYREAGMKKSAKDSYLKFLELVGSNNKAASDVRAALRHL